MASWGGIVAGLCLWASCGPAPFLSGQNLLAFLYSVITDCLGNLDLSKDLKELFFIIFYDLGQLDLQSTLVTRSRICTGAIPLCHGSGHRLD
ncbi:hypothetical protein DSUL_140056 [Desulfovibrionales bacterium]